MCCAQPTREFFDGGWKIFGNVLGCFSIVSHGINCPYKSRHGMGQLLGRGFEVISFRTHGDYPSLPFNSAGNVAQDATPNLVVRASEANYQ